MSSATGRTVSVFFVASPLHYLAARSVAHHFEHNTRCIVVAYQHGARKLIVEQHWDGVAYAPWPRFDPLPGTFGRHRRLLANLHEVAAIVGACDTLLLHSPVFDTEAVNYFLRALPRLCGANTMHARILPDGLLNIARHPLSLPRRAAQYLRKLRRLSTPLLDYWCFGGDRIGSEAPFVDRIYTLSGFPHDYPLHKVVTLPPLVSEGEAKAVNAALIVGQPLVAIGALSSADHDVICARIADWLKTRGIDKVMYKTHPRDPAHELRVPGAEVLEMAESLENHMASHAYRVVIGINSTALYLARQIYGPTVPVLSFGNDKVRFKNPDQRERAIHLMDSLGIERL